jgi:hypothetical protein
MASEKSPLHSLRGAVARSGSMRVIACLRQQCRRVRFPRDDFARRGKILAATTGLLLAYGITFALEGMTTRIPTTATWELATVALWTAPWLLLFCSGLQDVVSVTGKQWVLWFGGIAALLFLYYFDHYTSLSLLTKAAMPPIVLGIGLIPHFIRKMAFLFVLSSLAAGVAGAFVLYNIAVTLFTPTAHFATKVIAVLLVTFCLSAITSGLLAVFDLCRQMSRWSAT